MSCVVLITLRCMQPVLFVLTVHDVPQRVALVHAHDSSCLLCRLLLLPCGTCVASLKSNSL